MKKSFWWIIGAVLLLCGLVILDILIRSWFHFDLAFDATNFNNVGTPIIGIVSLVVYLITLLFLMKQNRVIQSQNLRPYFEKQIDNLYQSTKAEIIKGYIGSNPVEYNGLNFETLLRKTILELNENVEFLKDASTPTKTFKSGDISTRQYWSVMDFLSHFTNEFFHYKFHFSDTEELVNEINNSKLIEDEKTQLKNRIGRELLKDYMTFCWFITKHPKKFLVPIQLEWKPNDTSIDYKIVSLKNTHFMDDYNWFRQHLKIE